MPGRELPTGLGNDGKLVPDQLSQNRRREHADLLRADPEFERIAIPEGPAPAAGMEGDETEFSRKRHDGTHVASVVPGPSDRGIGESPAGNGKDRGGWRKGLTYEIYQGTIYAMRPPAVIRLEAYRCLRCGRSWYPRKPELPVRCPGCRSPYWQRPRPKKVTA
jgi:DNA-directed RNA polymerase subunit RPC12/RpoP